MNTPYFKNINWTYWLLFHILIWLLYGGIYLNDLMNTDKPNDYWKYIVFTTTIASIICIPLHLIFSWMHEKHIISKIIIAAIACVIFASVWSLIKYSFYNHFFEGRLSTVSLISYRSIMHNLNPLLMWSALYFIYGRSGPLVFVTVEHQCYAGEKLAITERQDLVYKQANPKLANLESFDPESISKDREGFIRVNSVELFRYSALTFNGHRIHYDRDYTRREEGYAGLVVHGPFQTTLLMNHAASLCDGVPARFSFRGVAPLIEQTQFQICQQLASDDQSGELWCELDNGQTTMQAKYWKQ